MNKHIERIIYTIALATGVMSLFLKMNTAISIILFIFSMLYLFLGWMLVNPERNKRFDLVYFIIGYSFSSSFIALLFNTRDYPLQDHLLYGSTAMLVLSLVLVLGIDRARKKPVVENAAKIVLLLFVVVTWLFIK